MSKLPSPLLQGAVGGACGAAAVTLAIAIFAWPSTVDWLTRHQGLAGWAQGLGVVLTLWFAFQLQRHAQCAANEAQQREFATLRQLQSTQWRREAIEAAYQDSVKLRISLERITLVHIIESRQYQERGRLASARVDLAILRDTREVLSNLNHPPEQEIHFIMIREAMENLAMMESSIQTLIESWDDAEIRQGALILLDVGGDRLKSALGDIKYYSDEMLAMWENFLAETGASDVRGRRYGSS